MRLRRAFLTFSVLGLVGLGAQHASASHTTAHHFSDNPGSYANVWIVDHTGPNWPIYDAAVSWTGGGRGVTYTSGSNCPDACIDLYARDLGTCSGTGGTTYGVTILAYNGAHLSGQTEVRVNQTCVNALNDAGRREIACHEEGHGTGALADGRPHSALSCMREGYVNGPLQRFPDDHDFGALRQMYDHND